MTAHRTSTGLRVPLFAISGHPPVAKDGFAVEYSCGCIREWCKNDEIAGLFTTLACERHKPKGAPGV